MGSVKSSCAVELSAIASLTAELCSSSPYSCRLSTRIWFCVSVPVLSVHITVVAPIVSQACMRRTRLLVLSMRRMLYARLSVTAIGRPSGTETTTSVTAIMSVFSK